MELDSNTVVELSSTDEELLGCSLGCSTRCEELCSTRVPKCVNPILKGRGVPRLKRAREEAGGSPGGDDGDDGRPETESLVVSKNRGLPGE